MVKSPCCEDPQLFELRDLRFTPPDTR